MSIFKFVFVFSFVTTVAHRKQFCGTRWIQHRGDFAHIADHSLERVLLLYQAPATVCNVLIILPIFSLQIETRAPQAQVVITCQNEDIIWQLPACCAAHNVTNFIFTRIHIKELIVHTSRMDNEFKFVKIFKI